MANCSRLEFSRRKWGPRMQAGNGTLDAQVDAAWRDRGVRISSDRVRVLGGFISKTGNRTNYFRTFSCIIIHNVNI